MTEDRVDTQVAALMCRVKPGTIRQWARRGKLKRRGEDEHRRALYNLDDVERLAQRKLQKDASSHTV